MPSVLKCRIFRHYCRKFNVVTALFWNIKAGHDPLTHNPPCLINNRLSKVQHYPLKPTAREKMFIMNGKFFPERFLGELTDAYKCMHHVCDVDWSSEYRLIYNLFNDADSNSAYRASNMKDDDEKWYGRETEENGCNAGGLGRTVLSIFLTFPLQLRYWCVHVARPV